MSILNGVECITNGVIAKKDGVKDRKDGISYSIKISLTKNIFLCG
jgi:hypothetical protein